MDNHRSDIAGAENYFTRVLSNADRFDTDLTAFIVQIKLFLC